MKFYLLQIILTLTIISCTPKSELGDDLFFTTNSTGDLSIGKRIPGYSSGNAHGYLVYGHITDYAFDSNFILIAEKPRDSVSGWKSLKYHDAEDIFRTSSFRQYYILDRNYDSLHGPVKLDQYIKLKAILQVPSELEIGELKAISKNGK